MCASSPLCIFIFLSPLPLPPTHSYSVLSQERKAEVGSSAAGEGMLSYTG